MKKRILVVDDQPDFGRMLQRAMAAYEIRQETDPAAALRNAYLDPPDLFILDLRMPGMTGTELAEFIQADPCLGRIPIIFVSASVITPEWTEEPIILHGLFAFGKPFDIPCLRHHIEMLLISGAVRAARIDLVSA